MPFQLPGNLPPVGAPPGFVPGQSQPPMPPAPPIPGGGPQNAQGLSPEQMQLEMQLIQLLMQNPAFAQAVTALRARRMAGQGGPSPLPGQAGPPPQGGGAPSPGGFADFVSQLQKR